MRRHALPIAMILVPLLVVLALAWSPDGSFQHRWEKPGARSYR